MKHFVTFLIILLTLGMIAWGVLRMVWERDAQEDLLVRTSDAKAAKHVAHIWGDDWLGYLVFRSPAFQRRMAEKGVRTEFRMVPDFAERFAGLADGRCQFVVATLDSYLSTGRQSQWPGVVIFVIDESYGGDAVIGSANVKNLDGLNRADIRGAFAGYSPSEFLMRSEVSHFQLDELRPLLEGFRVDSIDVAFQKFKSGAIDFAVLWEPLATQALREVSGAHVLIDTRHARGLIVDVALASRQVVAEQPQLATVFAEAYFATLHEWLNHPQALLAAAAQDSGKSPEDAAVMLRGIKFATFEDNLASWFGTAATGDTGLATTVRQITKILHDHGRAPEIPLGDPDAVLYRGVVASVPADGVPTAAGTRAAARTPTTYYEPLTDEQWEAAAAKVRGTLIEAPITFAPGSTRIPDDFQAEILDAVPKLAHYPDYRIVVEAHVAPSDDPAADRRLSEERALAVKRFLMWECGIPDERIYSRGMGSAVPPPARPGESIRAWESRTRRARILVVGHDAPPRPADRLVN
jgi:outer membrane protein OmpA-like peptidoglycan-associated protein/ABC-type amino acid transport substrate-binding protein